LSLRGRRQRHHAEHPGAHPFGDAFDGAALAGGVAALEDDADFGAGLLHPLLHRDELAVQHPHLLLVRFALHLLRPVVATPLRWGAGLAGRRSALSSSTTTGVTRARPTHASHCGPVSGWVSRPFCSPSIWVASTVSATGTDRIAIALSTGGSRPLD